jgi:hypothetical protein
MGVTVDVIEEVRNRLETAIGAGNALVGVKRVRVGSTEEARKMNDFPIINIDLKAGTLDPRFMRTGNVDILNIDILLVVNKLSSTSNLLYKTSDSTGSLYLLEKLLNTIEKNISGVVDLTFNGKVNNLKRYTYNITEDNDVVECLVSLELETRQFLLGGR